MTLRSWLLALAVGGGVVVAYFPLRAADPPKPVSPGNGTLDIESRKTLDTFSLSEGNGHVHIKTLEPDPENRFVMMVVRPAVT